MKRPFIRISSYEKGTEEVKDTTDQQIQNEAKLRKVESYEKTVFQY